jgi:hypothetical protein
MAMHFAVRVAAIVAATTIGGFASTDLKGDYNLEFVVQETPYAGTAKTVAGAKGAFTAKFEFATPAVIIAEVTGKTVGDSVTYEAKYEDKTRGCTGTFTGKGIVVKDATKANGSVSIVDSCSGALTGTFRLWR